VAAFGSLPAFNGLGVTMLTYMLAGQQKAVQHLGFALKLGQADSP